MENELIIKLLIRAIHDVVKIDNHLLKKDLSERSISHKLATYLKPRFKDYDVDCEYNGDIDSDNQRKKINILKTALTEINIELTKKEKADAENLLAIRAVFPDIIIHKRGENGKNNLCIIEVKKTSSSRIKCSFDDLKLKTYTAPHYHLEYQLGIFIEFGVGDKYTNNIINYYEGGARTDKYSL